jgi:hypothetical protein
MMMLAKGRYSMHRFLIVFLLSTIAMGCTANDVDPSPEQLSDQQDEGMFEGEIGEMHSNDALLIDSRGEVDGENDRISTTAAETLVREHLNVTPNSDTVVVYDSELENDLYVIHVYDLLDEGKDSELNESEGWYTVNAKTKEIQEYNK